MKKLLRLRPKVKLLTDFYVVDVETNVTYSEWCEQNKRRNKNFVPPPFSEKAIYWGLKARPENFKFGVIYGKNYCKIFHSLDEMLKELKTSRFKDKKVFAHNGGGYDYSVMFGNILEFDPKAVINGSRFICCTNGNATFCDSFNIFQTSVEKLGKMLGDK